DLREQVFVGLRGRRGSQDVQTLDEWLTVREETVAHLSQGFEPAAVVVLEAARLVNDHHPVRPPWSPKIHQPFDPIARDDMHAGAAARRLLPDGLLHRGLGLLTGLRRGFAR